MILDIILNSGFLKDLKSIWLNPNLSFKTIQTRNLDFNRFNPNPQTQILLSKCATKARFSFFFFFFFLRNHALVFSTSRIQIPWIIAFEVWTPRVKILSRTLLIASRWSFPRLCLLGEETSKTWTSTDLWDMNKHVRERERSKVKEKKNRERERELGIQEILKNELWFLDRNNTIHLPYIYNELTTHRIGSRIF